MEKYSKNDYLKTFNFRRLFLSSLTVEEKNFMFQILHELKLLNLVFTNKIIKHSIYSELYKLKKKRDLLETYNFFNSLPKSQYYFTYSLKNLQEHITKYKLNQSVIFNPIFLIAHFTEFIQLLDRNNLKCYLYDSEDYEINEYTSNFFKDLLDKLIFSFNKIFQSNNSSERINAFDDLLNIGARERYLKKKNNTPHNFLITHNSDKIPYCSTLSYHVGTDSLLNTVKNLHNSDRFGQLYPNVSKNLSHRFLPSFGII